MPVGDGLGILQAYSDEVQRRKENAQKQQQLDTNKANIESEIKQREIAAKQESQRIDDAHTLTKSHLDANAATLAHQVNLMRYEAIDRHRTGQDPAPMSGTTALELPNIQNGGFDNTNTQAPLLPNTPIVQPQKQSLFIDTGNGQKMEIKPHEYQTQSEYETSQAPIRSAENQQLQNAEFAKTTGKINAEAPIRKENFENRTALADASHAAQLESLKLKVTSNEQVQAAHDNTRQLVSAIGAMGKANNQLDSDAVAEQVDKIRMGEEVKPVNKTNVAAIGLAHKFGVISAKKGAMDEISTLDNATNLIDSMQNLKDKHLGDYGQTLKNKAAYAFSKTPVIGAESEYTTDLSKVSDQVTTFIKAIEGSKSRSNLPFWKKSLESIADTGYDSPNYQKKIDEVKDIVVKKVNTALGNMSPAQRVNFLTESGHKDLAGLVANYHNMTDTSATPKTPNHISAYPGAKEK